MRKKEVQTRKDQIPLQKMEDGEFPEGSERNSAGDPYTTELCLLTPPKVMANF